MPASTAYPSDLSNSATHGDGTTRYRRRYLGHTLGDLASLALSYAGDLLVAGYGETATRVPMYRLTLEIAGRTLDAMKVVGTPSNYALLGRDVLNRFLTTLDGPHLSFEITASDL